MRVEVDSLVRGKIGRLDRTIEGRVFSVARSGSVGVIRSDNGRQGIIYEPEPIGPPRPMNQRTDIPVKLR